MRERAGVPVIRGEGIPVWDFDDEGQENDGDGEEEQDKGVLDDQLGEEPSRAWPGERTSRPVVGVAFVLANVGLIFWNRRSSQVLPRPGSRVLRSVLNFWGSGHVSLGGLKHIVVPCSPSC